MTRLRRARGALFVLALGASSGALACSDSSRKTDPMMNQQTVSPAGVRLELEGLTLGARMADVLALVAAKGWQSFAPAEPTPDQRFVVRPTAEHPVKRFQLAMQDGVLASIEVSYRAGDPARVEALRTHYPRSKHGPEGWTMADARGQTLVSIDDAGTRVQALHTGVLRDRTEVTALFRMLLGEAPEGGPAAPAVAPPPRP